MANKPAEQQDVQALLVACSRLIVELFNHEGIHTEPIVVGHGDSRLIEGFDLSN